jgi:hypothetical protein
MRKVISTMMAVLVAVAVYAQAPKQMNSTTYPGWKKDIDFVLNDEVQPRLTKKEAVLVEDWYRFGDDWRALMGGFSQQNSFLTMFPDTFVKNLTLDENTNAAVTSWQNFCSMGAMFDANDDNWSDPDLAGLRDWYSYEIDSIFLTYGYFRFTGADVVDTLIIQVYNESQVTDGSFTTSQSQFGVVGYDQSATAQGGGIGANYSQIIKIPISELDSNQLTVDGTFRPKNLFIALEEPLVVPANGACAVTITYKPGKDYAFGDTLFFDEDLTDFGEKAPINRINRFGLLAAVQTPVYTALQSQNNGLFIARWNRYENPSTLPSFMHNKYYPNLFGAGNTQFGYYPYIAFKVNAGYDTGIEDNELENGFGLSNVFPNPASINDQMNLTFAINSSERVNITVYDLNGKEVKNITNAVYEQGEHNVTFDATNLNPGMYVYTMTAGNYITSKKFNVVK